MNYKLKIRLLNGELAFDSGIYFNVTVPGEVNFLTLHDIIMAATTYKNDGEFRFSFTKEALINQDESVSKGNRDAHGQTVHDLFSTFKSGYYTYNALSLHLFEFEISVLEVNEGGEIGLHEVVGIFFPESLGTIVDVAEAVRLNDHLNEVDDEYMKFDQWLASIGYTKPHLADLQNAVLGAILGPAATMA